MPDKENLVQESRVSRFSSISIAPILPYAILGVVVIGFFTAVLLFHPIGEDWETYHIAAQDWLHPYNEPKFVGMPTVLLALPHVFLSLEIGNAINMTLHAIILTSIIRVYGGGLTAVLVTFTSPMFLHLAMTNNIDWIPALAFLLPPMWGLPFLIAKPQMLGGAALIWWKRQGFSIKMLIPSIVVILISLLIWGFWLPDVIDGSREVQNTAWNFAPFPVGIPLGIYLLYKAYRMDGRTSLPACKRPPISSVQPHQRFHGRRSWCSPTGGTIGRPVRTSTTLARWCSPAATASSASALAQT
jgi:hypothetical protein